MIDVFWAWKGFTWPVQETVEEDQKGHAGPNPHDDPERHAQMIYQLMEYKWRDRKWNHWSINKTLVMFSSKSSSLCWSRHHCSVRISNLSAASLVLLENPSLLMHPVTFYFSLLSSSFPSFISFPFIVSPLITFSFFSFSHFSVNVHLLHIMSH